MDHSADSYVIRPNHRDKFNAVKVREIIHAEVREQLSGVSYDCEEIKLLSSTLSTRIKDRVRESGLDRYKLVVQVVIGEKRGQGVKMFNKCFWDADTDAFTEDVFISDNLFCVAAVFGSYIY